MNFIFRIKDKFSNCFSLFYPCLVLTFTVMRIKTFWASLERNLSKIGLELIIQKCLIKTIHQVFLSRSQRLHLLWPLWRPFLIKPQVHSVNHLGRKQCFCASNMRPSFSLRLVLHTHLMQSVLILNFAHIYNWNRLF